MEGREAAKDNDLFFTCSLIDLIGRKTKNRRSDVVAVLGRNRVEKIYELADVYHSDNIDKVAEDFIEDASVASGSFDNVGDARYAVPSHWDIGKVYKRLILAVAEHEHMDTVDAVLAVYESPVSKLIDDYNSGVYYDSPKSILDMYLHGVNQPN